MKTMIKEKTYHLPLAEWLGFSSFQKEENLH
jgi:hypothetical protein